MGELKNYGHELIDEYMSLTQVSNKNVYLLLKERMGDKPYHFGSMSNPQDVKLAIGYLKKMINKAKYQKTNQAVKNTPIK